MTPNKQTENATLKELKPCPFCGGEARFMKGNRRVCCDNPKCTVTPYSNNMAESDQEAMDRWNNRPSQPAIVIGYSMENVVKVMMQRDVGSQTLQIKQWYENYIKHSLPAPGRLPTVEECIKWMHDRFYSGKPLAKTDIMTYCQTPIK